LVTLEHGVGVSVDLRKAALDPGGADRGNADVQFEFCCCLEHGKGILIDFVEAVSYDTLSFGQGDANGL
jgi:hypothetical protein